MKTKRRAAAAILTLAGVVFLSSAFPAHAQSARFQVIAYTDLGSSASSGGRFTVSGAIGQSAGGQGSSGQFGFSDGFWNVLAAVQMPEAPVVSVERLVDGSIRIIWPLAADGFVLDHSSSIGPPALWVPTQLPYETGATHIFVTIPPPSDTRFYRLRAP